MALSLLLPTASAIGDAYHWETNSITPGQQGYANPNDTFDAFMKVADSVKAQAMITVNYGSNLDGTGGGDPSEAAAWVKYANITHHDNVQYWEIGNEIYGNGLYGNGWETDLHPDKSAVAYGENVLKFIDAMKAVDHHIKIGVVLTAPGNWPDGQSPDWNSTVLSEVGKRIDFVVVHWYAQNPGNESDVGLLGATADIASMVDTLRQEIQTYCRDNASRVQIMVTEANSVSYNPGKQSTSVVNGLFLMDDYLTWLEHGAQTVDWWDLHNGPTVGTNNAASLYGSTQFGDYGILSSGGTNGVVTEPIANTPFPAYHGLEMLTYLVRPRAKLVAASSDHPEVAVHAGVLSDGRLAVLVINRDSQQATQVSLKLMGFSAADKAVRYSYGKGSRNSVTSSVFLPAGVPSVTVAPLSVMTLIFRPKSSHSRGLVKKSEAL